MKFDEKNFGLSATIEHLKEKGAEDRDDIRHLVLACRVCNAVMGAIRDRDNKNFKLRIQ